MQELPPGGRGRRFADGGRVQNDRRSRNPGPHTAEDPLTAWISASNAGFHGTTPPELLLAAIAP